jgi:hypothetical protein
MHTERPHIPADFTATVKLEESLHSNPMVEVLANMTFIFMAVEQYIYLFMKSHAQQDILLLAFSTKRQCRLRISFSVIFGEGRRTERSLLDVNFRFALGAFHSSDYGKG